MSFESDMRRFTRNSRQRLARVHRKCADVVFKSVVLGSEITGAPGQPVDKGVLRGSWQDTPTSPVTTEITTNVVYAPGIEDGVNLRTGGPIRLRSAVGGFHSIKLTRAAWSRIVDYANEAVR